jgi:hypothetical protein
MKGKPQSATILKSVVAAFVAAFAATILFILPAEFGRDPTGVGRLLGLTQLADNKPIAPESSVRVLIEGAFPAAVEPFDKYEPPLIGLPFSSTSYDIDIQSDEFTIELAPNEQVEYKAVMNRGDMMVFTWTSDAEAIYSDFHADPTEDVDAYPEEYFVRYAQSEEPSGKGSLVAPFTGNHGWYWLNYGEKTMTIKLRVLGFYTEVYELDRSIQGG